MSKLVKTEGVVLKKKSLLNKDYLVTIFTKDQGKIRVLAKGVKKITSRRLSHLQTGNLIESLLNQKNERLYLQETKIISGFSKIKKDKNKVKNLYLFLFIIDRLLAENQKDWSVYQLLLNFLIDLSEKKNFSLDNFIEKLLVDLGYLNKVNKQNNLYSFIEEIINEKLPLFII
jgi:DNA repair protein RecO (recombination protein O)